MTPWKSVWKKKTGDLELELDNEDSGEVEMIDNLIFVTNN